MSFVRWGLTAHEHWAWRMLKHPLSASRLDGPLTADPPFTTRTDSSRFGCGPAGTPLPGPPGGDAAHVRAE